MSPKPVIRRVSRLGKRSRMAVVNALREMKLDPTRASARQWIGAIETAAHWLGAGDRRAGVRRRWPRLSSSLWKLAAEARRTAGLLPQEKMPHSNELHGQPPHEQAPVSSRRVDRRAGRRVAPSLRSGGSRRRRQNSPRRGVVIYPELLETVAQKPDGQTYQHKFTSGPRVIGLPNGDVLLESQGPPLWEYR